MSPDRAPILVLGLGNVLLADDGVGVVMLQRLAERAGERPDVELLDGGTQGLALLPWVADRAALLILDAVALGAEPGTVHELDDPTALRAASGATAHECNAGTMLAALELIGERPTTVVVGVEPAELRTRRTLSSRVERSVPEAVDRACRRLAAIRSDIERSAATCTS